MPIKTIAGNLGNNDTSAFIKFFKGYFQDRTPSDYRSDPPVDPFVSNPCIEPDDENGSNEN
jgi:AraC-like DNA-binding protein